MTDFNAKIKEEPMDDADLFMPAPLYEDKMDIDDQQRSHRRATEPDGNDYHTACFDGVYLNHPHHHLLRCGHHVMTAKVVVCGPSCMIGKKAGRKVQGRPFQCPQARCNVPISRNSQTGKRIPGRKCELSHVYGLIAAEDEQRAKEMADLATDGLAGMSMGRGRAMSGKLKQAQRKRSMSPKPRPRRPAAAQEPTRAPLPREAKTKVDEGAELNREFENEPGFEHLMKMSGPRIRKEPNGRFQTRAEAEQASREDDQMEGVEIPGTKTLEEIGTEAKRKMQEKLAASTAPDVKVGEREIERPEPVDLRGNAIALNRICDTCNEPLFGTRYKCFHRPDFDQCPECHAKRRLEHQDHHRFKAMSHVHLNQMAGTADSNGTFCKCKTTSEQYLVLCDCGEAFHPGCVDMGAAFESHEANHEAWCNGKECLGEDCSKVAIPGPGEENVEAPQEDEADPDKDFREAVEENAMEMAQESEDERDNELDLATKAQKRTAEMMEAGADWIPELGAAQPDTLRPRKKARSHARQQI